MLTAALRSRVVTNPAVAAHPAPHSQTCDTFRASDASTCGTGCGRISLVGLNISRPVPSGLIAKLIAERRPAGIEDGLCHPRLDQLDRVHIADGDQSVLSSDTRRLLVEMVAPGVGDLRSEERRVGKEG